MALELRPGLRLVAATHNPGKAVEIAELLEGRFETVSAGALGLAEPEETEATFIGNAVLKARTAADAAGLIAIADDSGLCVQALGGEPGVLSARWAEVAPGAPRDFVHAMARVEAALNARGLSDRRAYFACALAVAWPKGPVAAVQGEVHGRLVFPGRGSRGFGYDPIFVADGESLTFGEMDPVRKNAISHRARAFEALKAALF
ncbi:MAG: RdgB/HAM1 family non-canonical purine NTP pyrophosphatase [Pseudomonadota bacterium]|jgi:XTP/dITP diphosphohydrolase